MARVLAAALLAVAIGPVFAGQAAAHAELASSNPTANATLVEAPVSLDLSFTEAVDPGTARVRLLDERGEEVAGLGPATVEGTEVRVPLPALTAGVFTVDYRVTSAVDGHITSGLFAFLVDPTGTQPAPTVSSETDSLSSTPEATAARWVALAAALALAGSLIFWLGSARPAAMAVGAAPVVPWRVLALLGAVAVLGLVVYLVLAARPLVEGGANAGGWFPLDPAGPFGATPFAVAMRVALLGMLAATLLSVAGAALGRRDVAALVVTLGAALVGLAGMSLAGHAAATGGLLFAGFDFLHLAGVAAWLGALAGAAILVLTSRPLALAALRRHSRVALVAAPLVVLSGIANSPLVLGPEARDLVASEYGNLLLGKILLFAVAAGLGAANFFLVRRGSLRVALPVMAVELAVAGLAVVAAAGLVTGQPSANRPPVLVASGIGAEHLYGTAGPSTVHVAVNLPAPGDQRYQVSVTDAATGAYRDDVQRVFLEFVPPPSSGLAPERVQVEPSAEPGLWGVTGTYTPLVGSWTLDVVVRRAGERDETVSFPLEVVLPLPPQRVPPADTGIGLPLPLGLLWTVLPAGAAAWLVPAVLLGGAGALFVVARRRPGARGLAVARTVLVVLAVVAGIGAGSRALVAAANAPPPAAVAQMNPAEATEASVARGADLYLANCASCHGVGGSGDGPAAAGMLPPPEALPDRVREMTDGALAYRIAVGSAGSQMPAFAATLSENDRWDLVNYLRARWPR